MHEFIHVSYTATIGTSLGPYSKPHDSLILMNNSLIFFNVNRTLSHYPAEQISTHSAHKYHASSDCFRLERILPDGTLTHILFLGQFAGAASECFVHFTPLTN